MWHEHLEFAKAMGGLPYPAAKSKGMWAAARHPGGFPTPPLSPVPCPCPGPSPFMSQARGLLPAEPNTSTSPAGPAQTPGNRAPVPGLSPTPSHMAPAQLTLKDLLPSFTSANLGWGL